MADTIDLTNSDDDVATLTPPAGRRVVPPLSMTTATQRRPLTQEDIRRRQIETERSAFRALRSEEDIDEEITSERAKREYFLKPRDLQCIESFSPGGWGCGRRRYYRREDLLSYVSKYEQGGLVRLRERRAARRAKEEAKQRKADEAAAALSWTTATQASPEINRIVESLRTNLRRLMKKNLGVTMSGGPGPFRIEVPGVTSPVFAALVGRENDPDLRTFVRKGAFITLSVKTSLLLDLEDEYIQESILKDVGGVCVCPNDTCTVSFKPSMMLLSVKGHSVWPQEYDGNL